MDQLDVLVKQFDFTNELRSDITFVGSIRLDPARNVVELKAASGLYPTTGEHYIIGPLFQPKAVRQWLGFQPVIVQFFRGTDPITGAQFRLHDGTDQWWWNGSAWAKSTTDWNSEDEIAGNIRSFPATARKLRLVIRLLTNDPAYTPTLKWVKVAWSLRVNYLEDIIYRSLVPFLRQARFAASFAFKIPIPGGLKLPIKKVVEGSDVPFNVVGVQSVYNHTQDPGHYIDLLSSYDPVTQVATLSSPIPVGQQAFIMIDMEPEIVVEQSSQDYTEVEKVPAILIQNLVFRGVDSVPEVDEDHVVNKALKEVIHVRAPTRFDIRFSMITLAPGAVDLLRMNESIVGLVANQPFLKSLALDADYLFQQVEQFRTTTTPNLPGVSSQQGSFQIYEALAWLRPSTVEKPVLRLRFQGMASVDIP